MDNSNLWRRFEVSGDIKDYLNYIACTNEEGPKETLKEGDRGGCTDYSNWNGAGRHAGW